MDSKPEASEKTRGTLLRSAAPLPDISSYSVTDPERTCRPDLSLYRRPTRPFVGGQWVAAGAEPPNSGHSTVVDQGGPMT